MKQTNWRVDYEKDLLAVVLASMGISQAWAAPFTNGSFETIATGSAPGVNASALFGVGATQITGWTVTSGDVDLVGTNYFLPDFVASSGDYSVDLNGTRTGAIAQTFDTVAGQSYTVKFDLNINPYGVASGVKTVQVSVGNFLGTFDYDVTHHPLGQGGPWEAQGFTFVAGATSSTLTFQSLVSNSCCHGPAIDNVKVTPSSAVPIPGSLLLIGLGMTGLAIIRRKAK